MLGYAFSILWEFFRFAEAERAPCRDRAMPQHLIRKSDVSRLLQEPVTKSKKFPDGAGLYLEIRRQKNGDVKGYWIVQLSLGDGRRPQWFNIGPVGALLDRSGSRSSRPDEA